MDRIPDRNRSYVEEIARALLQFRCSMALAQDINLSTGRLLRIRKFNEQNVEFRQSSKVDNIGTVSGICAPYGSLSEDFSNGRGFFEVYEPGCFTESISLNDILSFGYHESSVVLGRTSNKTLRLTESLSGLRYELDLPDTQDGRDILTLVKRRDIKGTSCGFYVTESESEKAAIGNILHVIKGELIEVSLVPNPAYLSTSAQISQKKSIDQTKVEISMM
jgi:hypothetical protein